MVNCSKVNLFFLYSVTSTNYQPFYWISSKVHLMKIFVECGWEFVAQPSGTSGGVWRLHCNSYSTACTVKPKEIVLCSHFKFCSFVCDMQWNLFLSVSQWHGLSTNYSTSSKSVYVNLVQSLAINLPHTVRCNLQFTI